MKGATKADLEKRERRRGQRSVSRVEGKRRGQQSGSRGPSERISSRGEEEGPAEPEQILRGWRSESGAKGEQERRERARGEGKGKPMEEGRENRERREKRQRHTRSIEARVKIDFMAGTIFNVFAHRLSKKPT